MRPLSRRQVLQAAFGAAGASALPHVIACSSSEEGDENTNDELNAGQNEALRSIEKIVILMMENRSFDHYFGHLTMPKELGGEGWERFTPGTDQQKEGDRRINGLTGKEWNPTEPGGPESKGVKVFHAAPTLKYNIGDINHEWVECHNQWNPVVEGGRITGRGRMDGFIIEHRRDRGELALPPSWAGTCGGLPKICEQGTKQPGALICGAAAGSTKPFADKNVVNQKKLEACGAMEAPMSFYKRADTPVYHAFVDNFTLCDAWHASVCGPTWPNRYYVYSATAGGAIGTRVQSIQEGSVMGDRRYGVDTIWNVLNSADIDAMNFFGDAPLNRPMYGWDATDIFHKNRGSASIFEDGGPLKALFKTQGAQAGIVDKIVGAIARDESFETRCYKGNLPPVSYIEPPYFCADDHPPHDIQMGQAFVKSIYTLLYGEKANKEQADKTLLIVIYDEHGSFFDHYDPGLAYEKSSGPKDSDPNFRPLGFRVPAMMVGPMVKKAHVSHTVYDHTSVLTTIKNWVKVKFNKDLRAFKTYQSDGVTYDPNPRIAVAKDITDCLDPDYRGQGRDMPKMPAVGIKEADALASMYLNEGQSGFAEAYGMDQPDVRGKMEACKQVMEQMYRLGAIDIG